MSIAPTMLISKCPGIGLRRSMGGLGSKSRSLADISALISDVRFVPYSRHVQFRNRCLLCAKSRRQALLLPGAPPSDLILVPGLEPEPPPVAAAWSVELVSRRRWRNGF